MWTIHAFFYFPSNLPVRMDAIENINRAITNRVIAEHIIYKDRKDNNNKSLMLHTEHKSDTFI